jgi:hypothetical protein
MESIYLIIRLTAFIFLTRKPKPKLRNHLYYKLHPYVSSGVVSCSFGFLMISIGFLLFSVGVLMLVQGIVVAFDMANL